MRFALFAALIPILIGCSASTKKPPTTVAPVTAAPAAGPPLPDGAIARLGTPPLGQINSVALSADGGLLAAACDDQTVRLWRLSSEGKTRLLGDGVFRPLGPPFRHRGKARAVALSANGELIASAADRHDPRVVLRRVSDGKVLKVLEGHDSGVNALVFSADGKLLVSGGDDQTARIWDLRTGKQLRAVSPEVECGGSCTEEERITAVALTPDAKRMVTVHHFRATIWRVADGKKLGYLGSGEEEPEEEVEEGEEPPNCHLQGEDGGSYEWKTDVVVSVDGKVTVVADTLGCVELIGPGKRSMALRAHKTGAASTIAFSAPGKVLVIGGNDGALRVWDLASRKVVQKMKVGGSARSLALSAGGLLVAAGEEGNLSLWRRRSGKGRFSPRAPLLVWPAALVKSRESFKVALVDVDFSPDGKRLQTRDGKGLTRLWDVAARRPLRTLGPKQRPPHRPATLAIYGYDDKRDPHFSKDDWKTLHATAEKVSEAHMCCGGDCDTGYAGRVQDSIVSAQNDEASVNHEGDIELSTLDEAVVTPDGPVRLDEQGDEELERKTFAAVIGFSPDSKAMAAALYDHTIYLLSTKTGKKTAVLKGHRSEVRCVAFSSSSLGTPRVATGDMGGTVILWDARSGKRLRTLRTLAGPTYGLAFTPDGKLLASAGADGTALLWPAP